MDNVVDFYKEMVESSSFAKKEKFGIQGYYIPKAANLDVPDINV
jgi:hypothetical protein